MSTHDIKMFSFAEIAHNTNCSVRLIDERLLVAVDLIVTGTGKNRDDSARVLRDLREDVFPESNYQIVSLPGKGNGKIKTVDFKNAITLIMIMPGRMANDFRQGFARIIERFMAGDRSLILEIHANASSSNPLAQMARASLASAGSSAAPFHKSIEGPAQMAGVSLGPSLFDFRSVPGLSGGAPSAPVMGAAFQSMPLSTNDPRKAALDARTKELNQRKAELDARAKELNKRKAALDARNMALNCKEADLDGRATALNLKTETLKSKEAELDARDAQFIRRSTELHEKEAELSNINAGMLIRGLEQESIKSQQDARNDGLDERETDLDRREDEVEKRWSAVIKREAELDKRDAQITERQDTLLRALNAESDKNHAALETKRAELDARAAEADQRKAELDARIAEADQRKAKLDARAAEADKRKAELDARAAEADQRKAELDARIAEADALPHDKLEVVVAEEVQPGRKRQREVDFSLVTQMGVELEKILAMNLDAETKQELKQRLYDMLRAE